MNVKPCECKEPGFCKRFQRRMTPNLFHLCQTREDYRELWDRKLKTRKEKSSVPSGRNKVQSSLPQKVQRYGKAIVRWISAGRPVRSDEEVDRIYDEYCKGCKHRADRSCVLCGCTVSKSKVALTNKVKMGTESCPKELWGVD